MLKFKEIGVFFEETGPGSSRDPSRGPSRDPGPGPNRAPIFAFLGTAFGQSGIQSGSSRDPVGAPIFEFLAPTFGPVGEAAKIHRKKHGKNTAKMLFFMNLAASRHWCPTGSRLDPDWIPTGSRLDPDWIPTGQKRCPKMQKLVPDWVPDGILTGSIDWQEPTPAPIFPFPDPPFAPIFLFPRTSRAPIPPPPAPKR